ncbi:MAG: EamA family transporter [Planctomycetota bacterium]
MHYLSFVAICLLFGSNFFLMSQSLQAFGPAVVGAGRVFGAWAVVTLLWWLTARGARLPRRAWLPALFIGLLANGYPYLMQPYLIREAEAAGMGGGHSFFGVMVAFTPLLTILVSIPMLGVKPTWRQLVGVVVGLGFMFMLMLDGGKIGVTPAMLVMAVSVPLSYAVANTYLRRTLSDAPAVPLTAMMLTAPALLLTPLAIDERLATPLHLEGPAEPTNFWGALAAILMLGVTGTGLTMWLFVRLVQARGPLFAGMVTYVVPLVALAWGVFDGERILPRQMVAIAGVLAMVALVQFGGPKPTQSPPPPKAPEAKPTRAAQVESKV